MGVFFSVTNIWRSPKTQRKILKLVTFGTYQVRRRTWHSSLPRTAPSAQRNHLLPPRNLGPDPIKKCHEAGCCKEGNQLVRVASCCWCKQTFTCSSLRHLLQSRWDGSLPCNCFQVNSLALPRSRCK